MPEKDPTTWTAATWLLALGMAFGGGIVNWYAKVRRGLACQIEAVRRIGKERVKAATTSAEINSHRDDALSALAQL